MRCFLLRSSEYAASSGFFDVKRVLLVGDVEFFLSDQPEADWWKADEVVICIRASKTDQRGLGVLRNAYATGKDLCLVWAAAVVMDLRGLDGGDGMVLATARPSATVHASMKACELESCALRTMPVTPEAVTCIDGGGGGGNSIAGGDGHSRHFSGHRSGHASSMTPEAEARIDGDGGGDGSGIYGCAGVDVLSRPFPRARFTSAVADESASVELLDKVRKGFWLDF
ncbi:hypothetical protein M885DRAFT_563773 [Pelagophyceae sp. CCMP2097]|nr:hypothetical protein M885DRAFT_563773 [Pelagophyceae sp. CCMP2097]